MQFTILALQRDLEEKIDKLDSFVRKPKLEYTSSRCMCELK